MGAVHFFRTIAFIICLTVLLQSCGGSTDSNVTEADDYWVGRRDQVVFYLQQLLSNFDYIAHIDFTGEDFGMHADEENKIYFYAPNNPGGAVQNKRILGIDQLPEDQPSLWIQTAYRDPSILFSISYRRYNDERAADAFSKLFLCNNHSSNLLKRTLVIGTGASHGVPALESFSLKLQDRCGKKIDVAFVGDGIDIPGPFSKREFDGVNSQVQCLHFFQTNWQSIFQGAPMKNCTNVHVEDASHSGSKGMSDYPYLFVTKMLSELDRSKPDLGLPQTLDHNFKSYYPRW